VSRSRSSVGLFASASGSKAGVNVLLLSRQIERSSVTHRWNSRFITSFSIASTALSNSLSVTECQISLSRIFSAMNCARLSGICVGKDMTHVQEIVDDPDLVVDPPLPAGELLEETANASKVKEVALSNAATHERRYLAMGSACFERIWSMNRLKSKGVSSAGDVPVWPISAALPSAFSSWTSLDVEASGVEERGGVAEGGPRLKTLVMDEKLREGSMGGAAGGFKPSGAGSDFSAASSTASFGAGPGP
jgi:hypothetical protein